MAPKFTTTVTDAGKGAWTLSCTCGEQVTYWGHQFTQVEAMRHEAWHAKQEEPQSWADRRRETLTYGKTDLPS